MNSVIIAACAATVINMAWLIICGIRDHLNRAQNGDIQTNIIIATRNIKGACINIALAIIVIACRILHLP